MATDDHPRDDDDGPDVAPLDKSQLPPELAHDDREIRSDAITWFTVGLGIATLVAMAAMWWLNGYLEARGRQADRPPSPIAGQRQAAPPSPRLLPRPEADLAALRAEEAAQLGTYGWVDAEQGVVRLPIDRAIELLAKRGLPTREHGPPREPVLSQPTDSSLGLPATEGPSPDPLPEAPR